MSEATVVMFKGILGLKKSKVKVEHMPKLGKKKILGQSGTYT